MELLELLRRGWVQVILSGALVLAGCSSVQITREASAPSAPSWIGSLPQKPGMLYFAGIATGADTLEQGREAALKDALAKIAALMGAKVQSRTDDVLTETEQHIRRQIRSRSSATVRGAYETDSYHERIVRVEKNIRLEKFDVYVLVGIPAMKVEAEIGQQRQDQARRVSAAGDLFLQGKKRLESKEYAEARRLFGRGLKLLEGTEDVVLLPDGASDNRQLILALNAEIQKANRHLKRVALAVRAEGVFQTAFAAALSAKGYSVSVDDPAIEVSGGVTYTEDGSVWNRWSCRVEGHLSAMRRSDGQVIAIQQVRGFGVHQSRRQAMVDALTDAAETASQELAGKLARSEQ